MDGKDYDAAHALIDDALAAGDPDDPADGENDRFMLLARRAELLVRQGRPA